MAYLSTLSTLPANYELREGPPPDLVQWPLAFNIDDLFEVVYRAKSWKLMISGSVQTEYATYEAGEEIMQTLTMSLDSEVEMTSPAEMTELDLACGRPQFIFSPPAEDIPIAGSWTSTDGLSGELRTASAILTLAPPYDAYVDGEHYWIPLHLWLNIVSDSVSYLVVSSAPPLTEPHETFNIIFNGKTLKGYVDSWTGKITSAPISTSVEISRWWPYDPDDGEGPIWNELSGTAFRNPFSVQH